MNTSLVVVANAGAGSADATAVKRALDILRRDAAVVGRTMDVLRPGTQLRSSA